MAITHTSDGTLQIAQTDLAEHIKFFGTSGQGKSMLSRLNETERQEWWEWAKAKPDVNGMDWPGWSVVRAREAAAISGDAAQNVAGIVYNEAFHRDNQK
ncbi:MAG: hypothetical protein KJZ92_17775 [Rhodocyclaceae bacterium]|nr:hypothetical protein [Rhodocyclaceae bacterium]